MRPHRLIPILLGKRAARSSLLNGLVAYWKMDESSDGSGQVERADSGPNAFTLTDYNTTPSGTGIVSSGAAFASANSEYLGRVDDAKLRTGAAVFFDFWVKRASLATQAILSKGDTANTTGEFVVYLTNAPSFVFRLRTTAGNQNLTLNGGPNTNVWTYYYCYYDAGAGKIYAGMNNGAVQELAISGTPYTGNGSLYVGGQLYNAGVTNFFNGLIDEVGVWDRILTTAEITARYNGGAGLTYPFSTPASGSGAFTYPSSIG
mgnify:CR=1 FL=1